MPLEQAQALAPYLVPLMDAAFDDNMDLRQSDGDPANVSPTKEDLLQYWWRRTARDLFEEDLPDNLPPALPGRPADARR
jgi:hypothetical protein